MVAKILNETVDFVCEDTEVMLGLRCDHCRTQFCYHLPKFCKTIQNCS